MSALSLRYGAELPHTGLIKFMHAAGDGHVQLLERHAVALQPQAGDTKDIRNNELLLTQVKCPKPFGIVSKQNLLHEQYH